MSNQFTLFSTAVKCESEAQIDWVRETMEALDRMVYEDWRDEDIKLVKDRLDIDEDDVFGVPSWDLADDNFYLYSEEEANVELTACILQGYLIRWLPVGTCHVLSYALTCSRSQEVDAFGGGAMLITGDNIEGFDPTEIATNKAYKLEKEFREKGLVAFGTNEESN